MVCKFCGAENPLDDAVFCGKCGKRLDGSITCAGCGKSIPSENAFCPYCGLENVCKKSANGDGVNAAAISANTNKRRTFECSRSEFAKIVIAFALVAVSLVFVFLIGVNGSFFYTYFGSIYKNINNALISIASESDYYAASLYAPAVFGTVISAATIVCVVSFSALAVVKGIQGLSGKSSKPTVMWAFYAFAAYVAGTVCLYVLSNFDFAFSQDMGELLEEMLGNLTSVKTGLNGASVAGIIIGAIIAVGLTIYAFALRAKTFFAEHSLFEVITLFANIVITLLTIVFLSLPVLGWKITLVDEDVTYKASMNIGFIHFWQVIGIYTLDNSVAANMTETSGLAWCSILGMVALIMLIVLAFVLLYANIKRLLANSINNHAFDLNVITVVLSVVLLGMSIGTVHAFTISYKQALGLEKLPQDMLAFNYAVPIVICVFSVIVTVLNIIGYYLSCRKNVETVKEISA